EIKRMSNGSPLDAGGERASTATPTHCPEIQVEGERCCRSLRRDARLQTLGLATWSAAPHARLDGRRTRPGRAQDPAAGVARVPATPDPCRSRLAHPASLWRAGRAVSRAHRSRVPST